VGALYNSALSLLIRAGRCVFAPYVPFAFRGGLG